MPKSIVALVPPHVFRFTSNTDHNVPIRGAGMPGTADFVVVGGYSSMKSVPKPICI